MNRNTEAPLRGRTVLKLDTNLGNGSGKLLQKDLRASDKRVADAIIITNAAAPPAEDRTKVLLEFKQAQGNSGGSRAIGLKTHGDVASR